MEDISKYTYEQDSRALKSKQYPVSILFMAPEHLH